MLNLSSPLLHMSKLASALELKTAKTMLFALFAAVFFVTRVLLFPYFILKWCVQLAGQQQQQQTAAAAGRSRAGAAQLLHAGSAVEARTVRRTAAWQQRGSCVALLVCALLLLCSSWSALRTACRAWRMQCFRMNSSCCSMQSCCKRHALGMCVHH
jgi:hypothetical protein